MSAEVAALILLVAAVVVLSLHPLRRSTLLLQ